MRRTCRIALHTVSCSLVFFFVGGIPLAGQTADPNAAVPATTPAAPAGPATPVPSDIQNPDAVNQPKPGATPVDKRVFGVLPNYRTANGQAAFVPLTVKGKFIIATKDSFDYPVYFTTAFFAGISQMQGSDNRIYGQGTVGFFHRFGISYVDQVVGNYFPEAIIPSIFHVDPRYYRKGEGSFKGRLWYAVSRILVCKNDKGEWTFNAPEIVGNISAATASRAYHPHERTAGDAAEQFGTYVETDLAGQILKEFWPDVKRWYHNRHQNN